jgi:hypothetical protein
VSRHDEAVLRVLSKGPTTVTRIAGEAGIRMWEFLYTIRGLIDRNLARRVGPEMGMVTVYELVPLLEQVAEAARSDVDTPLDVVVE